MPEIPCLIYENAEIVVFGGLRDVRIEFSPGLNLIEAENEAGKSTLAAFIRYMLYGMNKAERTLHTSFESGEAGGELTLRVGEKRYRIGRALNSAGKEKVQVIDLDTNSQIKPDGEVGEWLLGIPSELFDATAYVSQLGGGYVGGRETGEAIENLLFSADESISVKRALKKLDERRISLLYKNQKGGLVYNLERERAEMELSLEKAIANGEEIFTLRESAKKSVADITANNAKINELQSDISCLEALTVIPTFNRAADEEKRLKELDASLEHTIEKNTLNGFIPDEGYVKALKEAQNKIIAATEELSAAESLLADEHDRTDAGDINSAGMIKQLVASGGADAVTKDLKTLRHRQRKKRSRGITLCVTALVFVIAAAVSALVFKPGMASIIFTVAFAAVAVTSAIIASVSLVAAAAASSECRAVLERFGAGSDGELAAKLERLEKIDSENRDAVSRVEELREKRGKARTALSERMAEADALLARWGRGGTSVSETLSHASALLAELDDTQRERHAVYRNLGILRESLAKYDEQSIRALAQNYESGTDEAAIIATLKKKQFELDFIRSTQDARVDKAHRTDVLLAEKNANFSDPAAIRERLGEIEKELVAAKREYEACVAAYDAMCGADEDLRGSIAPNLSREAGRLLGEMTDGKYCKLGIDSSLSMQYEAGEGALRTRDVIYMSSGTRDIAYLCLRFALSSLLCRRAYPPIIFDESFARLDDMRFAAAVQTAVSEMKTSDGQNKVRQVIILTSQTRDKMILQREKISFFSVHLR